MNNPIQPNNMFATPKDVQEFQKWLDNLSGNEAMIAMTASAMAWNLASKIIDEELTQ